MLIEVATIVSDGIRRVCIVSFCRIRRVWWKILVGKDRVPAKAYGLAAGDIL